MDDRDGWRERERVREICADDEAHNKDHLKMN